MNVYFYTSFSKKTNSTKQPATTGSSFVVKDCKLKQDCSEHTPSFILSSNEYGYTYVYVPTWNKFYFVTDVVSLANGLVEYHCSEDFLATFRENVMSTSSGILYSSYGYDVMIPDPRIKIRNHKQIDFSLNPNPVFSESYGYIITVFSTLGGGAYTPAGGITSAYLVSQSGIGKVKIWLSLSGMRAAITDFVKGKVSDAIVSCIRVPYFDEVASQSYALSVDHMVIGDRDSRDDDSITFSTGELYNLIGVSPQIYKTFTIDTNLRYTDFRAYEPYTNAVIYLPGIGTVPISKGEFMGNAIVLAVFIDVITGDVKYFMLSGAGGATIATYTCNVSSNCPLVSVTTNGSGILTGIGTAVAGVGALAATIATEGGAAPIAAAAFAAIGGVSNTVLSSNMHSFSVSGGFSNALAAKGPYIKYYEVSVDTQNPDDPAYLSLYGRPYIGNALLSTLLPAGYTYPTFVQTIDAHVNPTVTGGVVPNLREQTEINNALNSGIYLE